MHSTRPSMLRPSGNSRPAHWIRQAHYMTRLPESTLLLLQAITEQSESGSRSDGRSLKHNSSSGHKTDTRSLPHNSSGKKSERSLLRDGSGKESNTSLPHDASPKENDSSLRQIQEGVPDCTGQPMQELSGNSAVIGLLSTK